MSFTAAYSELQSLADHGPRRGVKVTDYDGLQAVHESVDISEDTYRDLLVLDEWDDRSAYPTETWKVLKGFKTWKPEGTFNLHRSGTDFNALRKTIENHEDYRKGPLGYGYNIERVGIEYDGLDGLWKQFFAKLSEYTDPFAFYQSPYEHEFPDVTDFDEGTEMVYYCECHDGDVFVEKRMFERTETEVLMDEIGEEED